MSHSDAAVHVHHAIDYIEITATDLRQDAHVRAGGPLVVLYSRTLDDTMTDVKKAGGRIVQEPFSFPGGRRFHFSDPSGNELAVWSEA